MRVLKMTVPICYFSQFARPLWSRIRVVDDERWKQAIACKVDKDVTSPSISTNSKLVSPFTMNVIRTLPKSAIAQRYQLYPTILGDI